MDTLKILITGDFYTGNRIESLIEKNKFHRIFNDFLPIIKNQDISITNLESPITLSTSTIEKTGPSLKALPGTAEALKFAEFKAVTLANNHIMDYGELGLGDTIKALDKNDLKYFGAGMNKAKASQPLTYSSKNQTIALISIAENEWSSTTGNHPGTNPLDPIDNYNMIKEAKLESDYVFVIIHGGHENYSLPSPRMKATYRFFIEAGADAVIGHHPHCYSGYEKYNQGLIFYSLGNFIFDDPNKINTRWNSGFAVQFRIKKGVIEHELIPYYQNRQQVGLELMTDNEKKLFKNDITRLNTIIQNDLELEKELYKQIKKVERGYRAYIEPHSNRYLHALRNRGLFPSFLSKRKRLLLLNLIRCESHRDVLIRILDNENSHT